MDYVTIENYRVHAVHGEYAYEREQAQEFEVSLKVGADLSAAGKSDALTDTIDFDRLKAIVDETFARASLHLVEALGERIAARILAETSATEAEVAIRKLAIWENGVPGVVIVRRT